MANCKRLLSVSLREVAGPLKSDVVSRPESCGRASFQWSWLGLRTEHCVVSRQTPVEARLRTGYGASERSRAEGEPNGCHGNRYFQNGRGYVFQGVQGSSRPGKSARRVDL